MDKFTLRNKISEAKASYVDPDGSMNQYWRSEGLPWAIQDYHSSVGSILDFTGDDIAALNENGWTLMEAYELCEGETPDEVMENFSYQYMLLSRLKADCDYYLGCGNRCVKHLWAGSVIDQIRKMRELYNQVPAKPRWLSGHDIDEYEKKMMD